MKTHRIYSSFIMICVAAALVPCPGLDASVVSQTRKPFLKAPDASPAVPLTIEPSFLDMGCNSTDVALSLKNPTTDVTMTLTSWIHNWQINMFHTGFEKNGQQMSGLKLLLDHTVTREDGGRMFPRNELGDNTNPFFLAAGSRGYTNIKMGLEIQMDSQNKINPGTYSSFLVFFGSDGFETKEAWVKITVHISEDEMIFATFQESASAVSYQ